MAIREERTGASSTDAPPTGAPPAGAPVVAAAPTGSLQDLLVTDEAHWGAGPPHGLFTQLREHCPVHWTARIDQEPGEPGYWSVVRPEEIRTVSRDWRTYSSERGGVTLMTHVFPLELQRAMFIGMDPPRHDRLKNLFQAGFTPRRIAAHEPAIRRIVADVLDGLAGRDEADLVTDVAQPIVSRVIGSFMGVAPEEDAEWARLMNGALSLGDPELNPEGAQTLRAQTLPEIFRRCQALIAARRQAPTGDLTSVLVHAEIDGERLTEPEIVMGFFLLMAAGNDSTKATYCSAMRALMADPAQRAVLTAEPALIPAAVEEALRMFPAFAHFRRTATCDTELGGQPIREGEKVVMWYVASGRDAGRYEGPDRFDVRRHPEHQAFGAGGRHFCLGAALARLELRVMLEETLARYPRMTAGGAPSWVPGAFLNQLKTLPVTLDPARPICLPAHG
ncbi:MAG TPA: cytochrome P450 [Solirubrobacteraceae bacterium]|nr:cytochrome P450 [Solirubrobacteraceae bacterium]